MTAGLAEAEVAALVAAFVSLGKTMGTQLLPQINDALKAILPIAPPLVHEAIALHRKMPVSEIVTG